MTKIKVLGAATMSLALTKDRWYNVAMYLKSLPPWAKERLGRSGLSVAQQKVTDAFAEIQTSLNEAGLDRWQRRQATARIMRKGAGGFGGVKLKFANRTPVPEDRLKAAISTATSIVGRYATAR